MKLFSLLAGLGRRKGQEDKPVHCLEENEKEDLLEIFRKVERFMIEKKPYLDGDLCIAELSRSLYTSRPLVSLAINQCTGMNFRSYLNSYRVDYAASLIRSNPDTKLEEVSRMSGFNTLPTFNSAFRKKMGLTPSAYSRQIIYPKELLSSLVGEVQ